MLYLNPPFHVVDDVSLMPDHADPLQFYYMPMSPHLTVVKDPVSGQRIPQIQLIEYTGELPAAGTTEAKAVAGGFLNFDCNLGIDSERLTSIASELKGKANLPDTPRLSPVPLVDGSVRLMLLDAESPAPEGDKPKPTSTSPTAATPAGPRFVVKISHGAKPSLYGDNQAAFSVQLDHAGAVTMRQALMGEMTPIGVVYSLSFLGLRPAYHVKVTADWDRVQTHLESSFKTNLVVYSSQIDEVVDKLVEDKVILIEGDLFVAEGDGSSGGEAERYQQAMTECREMVTQTFFQPSLEPMESDRGGALDTFERVSQVLATGGHGSLFSYSSVDLTRIDRKSLEVNMSERTAVLRSIYPQGHLAGLARIIADENLDLARFTLRVSLEDDFYKRRRLKVIPRASLAQDHIQSINVALTYEGDTKNVVFDGAENAAQEVDWPSVLDGTDMRRPVSYSYKVGFDSAIGHGRPSQVTSGELPFLTGDVVEIEPRRDGLYDVMPVAINCVDCPWDVYPTVELSCRYQDAENGIDIEDNYTLTATAGPGASWPVFMIDKAKQAFSYRLVYHGADGRDVEKDWVETTEGQIRVADPFGGRRRTLTIAAPSGLFETDGLDRAFVSASYADTDNGVSKQESFEIVASDTASKRFQVELVDPERREVSFKVKLLFKDGRTVEVPESSTVDDVLILRADLKGHRSVTVRPEPTDFKASGLREILVEARYEDTDAQLSFADDIRLHAATEQGRFEFDFVDAAKDTYRYRVTHSYENGLSKTGDWIETDAGALQVPVG